MPGDEYQRAIQQCAAHSIKPTNHLLVVSVSRQEMTLYENGEPRRRFKISTSKNPPSCVADSEGTPDGLHVVADRIGADAPLGTVFKGRVSTGRLFSEMPTDEQIRNLITTRILRLRGLEPGHNAGEGCDSYNRYIYIHGTNHEDRLGTPQSAGCVLMANAEIAALFPLIPSGTIVSIQL